MKSARRGLVALVSALFPCLAASAATVTLDSPTGGEEWGTAAAEVVLRFTGRYAGDNYLVEAVLEFTDDDPFDWNAKRLADKVASVFLVAWKRVHVEELRMCKVGSGLAADFVADADSDPDTVEVNSSVGFYNTCPVVIVDKSDALHKRGEKGHVVSIAGNSLTLDIDLMSYAKAKEASVLLIEEGTYYAAALDSDDVLAGFGGDSLGLDGGCFVEFVRPMVGGEENIKYVPFQSSLGMYVAGDYDELIQVLAWTEYGRYAENCIALCGLCGGWFNRPFARGVALHNAMGQEDSVAAVFVGWIRGKPTNPRTTEHEIGHVVTKADHTLDRAWNGGPNLMDPFGSGMEFDQGRIDYIRQDKVPFNWGGGYSIEWE